jgi:hypothetical protein
MEVLADLEPLERFRSLARGGPQAGPAEALSLSLRHGWSRLTPGLVSVQSIS